MTAKRISGKMNANVEYMSSGTYIEPLNYAQTLTCHFLYTLLAVVRI